MTDPLVTAFGSYDYDVVDHIVQWSDANGLPPVAQLAMGLQESNLDPFAVGDTTIGGSYGVFQIYLPVHGGPSSQWTGLSGLDNSMAEMRAAWQSAFATTGSWAAWLADPIAFQQAYAPLAQGSIAWTHAMAAERVGQAIVLLVLYLKTLAAPAPPEKRQSDNNDIAHVVQLMGRLDASGNGAPDWASVSAYTAGLE